jgi:hypothetical protein
MCPPVLLVTGAVLLALALGSAPMTAAAQEEPTIVVGDATVDAGERVTVDVVLTETPEGLAGYEVTVTLDGDADARVTGAEYPDALELTSDPAIGTDGQSVRLEAADLEERIQPGATDVRLATVTVSAESAGEATVDVSDVQVDADGGARVSPAVEAGQLTVRAGEPTATASGNGESENSTSEESASDGAPADEDANATSGADGPGFGALLALAVVALFGGTLAAVRSR